MTRFAAAFLLASTAAAHPIASSAQVEPPDAAKELRLIGNGALGLHEGDDVQAGAFGVDYRTETSNTTGRI